MRGKRAKELRRMALRDGAGQENVVYTTIRISHRTTNTITVLEPECNRAFYKYLKKLWKAA